MSIKFRSWEFMAVCGLALIAVGAAIHAYLQPQYTQPAQLAGLLPREDATLIYADVGALRTSGFLSHIQQPMATEEPEYQRFVRETGFSYERDLDAFAAALLPDETFVVLRGRFRWSDLEHYARQHGGSCEGRYCEAPASKPGRIVSFFPIRWNVMALAVSADGRAALRLKPGPANSAHETPSAPVWVQVPRRVLSHPDAMPPVAQVFATALAPATGVTLTISQPKADLVVRMIAQCETAEQTNGVRQHLARLVGMFGSLAQNTGALTPGTDKLARLFASGRFQSHDRLVEAEWRVPPTLVDALLSSSESNQ